MNEKEKKLKPNACITYRRPTTIGQKLLNYKKIAHEVDKKDEKYGSKKCEKCGICGNFGKLKNMVKETDEIKTKDGKSIKLKQSLNCSDYGIYAGICKICGEIYVGQTATKFNIRWTGHRTLWNETMRTGKEIKKEERLTDEKALSIHYLKYHKNINSHITLADAFEIVFLEKPAVHRLDVAEDFWISKMNATINIRKTFLPTIK